MSLFDRFFDKDKNKKSHHRSDDETPPFDNEGKEAESNESFLDRIGEFALKARQEFAPAKSTPTDLQSITIDAYDEPVIGDSTQHKIDELKSIINAIESKPHVTTPVTLQQEYKINYQTELNPAQLEAVTTIKGPVLVIAGAGSGKTRVIVHRVAFMLENGIPPQAVLMLTFTRRAAKEMIGRVQELLKEQSVEKIFGGTFHSFSNYVLRAHSNLLQIPANFTIMDTEDSADTIDLIRSELKLVDKDKAFPKNTGSRKSSPLPAIGTC